VLVVVVVPVPPVVEREVHVDSDDFAHHLVRSHR